MISRSIMTYISIIFISFCSLVTIKFYASDLKDNVLSLEKEKADELSQIKVLKAEWAFLNKADRLQYLSTKYLAMNEAKSSKITAIGKEEQAKVHLVANNNEKQVAILHKRVNWRYKDRSKILTHKKAKHKGVEVE